MQRKHLFSTFVVVEIKKNILILKTLFIVNLSNEFYKKKTVHENAGFRNVNNSTVSTSNRIEKKFIVI